MAMLQGSIMHVPVDLFSRALGIKAVANKANTSVVLYLKESGKDTVTKEKAGTENKASSAPIVDTIPQAKPKFTYSMNLVGFYSAGMNAKSPALDSSIMYAYKFNQNTARIIYHYVKVTCSNLTKAVNVPVVARYYRRDGSLLHETKKQIALQKWIFLAMAMKYSFFISNLPFKSKYTQ